MLMAVTLPGLTLTVAVPLIPFLLAVMVTGLEVMTAPVTTPEEVIGTDVVSALDQKTPLVRVLWLPSSNVPVAVICNIVPCWILAVGGPTVMVVS